MATVGESHPYCAVAVALVPLDAEGDPQPEHTVTLIGEATVMITMDGIELGWREDRLTGARFVLTGPLERL